tara:strand:- start:338 stop:535 length:198 start_codon:yes stop_codon:yes gene_type:complete
MTILRKAKERRENMYVYDNVTLQWNSESLLVLKDILAEDIVDLVALVKKMNSNPEYVGHYSVLIG